MDVIKESSWIVSWLVGYSFGMDMSMRYAYSSEHQ